MAKIIKLAVLGSTRGTDLQYLLGAISSKTLDAQIVCVVSNKADAYILERARTHGIPAISLESKGKSREQFDSELIHQLSKWKIDLILLIGYMRILTPTFVRAYKYCIMNVHPSLLPKYAGGMDMNVYDLMIKNKDKEGGITIHFVDEGVDTGPIILQKRYKIDPKDTAETLKVKGQKLEGEGFVEAITLFSKGKIKIVGNKVKLT